jgi:3',5'-cyclic AMP phosphodiesterase CpdA
MDINVLIVDDEVFVDDERRKQYGEVCDAINLISGTCKFNFLYPDSGMKAWVRLGQGSIDFVFLDLVLGDEWLSGVTFGQLLSQIDSVAPFAIVTSKFDVSNREQLSAAISQSGCKCFLRWADLHEPKDVSTFLFMLISEMAVRLKALDTSVVLKPDDPIYILHLSDVQYGGFSTDPLAVEMQAVTQKVKTLCKGGNPTFVTFTGDFAETGAPSQFDECFSWIKNLLGRLGFDRFPSPRVLVVPGNHDVCLPLSSAGNLFYKDGTVEVGADVRDARLNELGLHHYEQFSRRVSSSGQSLETSTPHELRLGWLNDAFLHLGIVFYGLNTTTPLVARKLPKRMVSNAELGDLAKKLNAIQKTWREDSRDDEPFVIGLSHHSPTADVDDRGVQNPDEMMRFILNNPTHLFLHGHVHHSDTEFRSVGHRKAFVKCCASTISKASRARLEDTNRGFNLIELERQNGVIIGIKIDVVEWRGQKLEEAKEVALYQKGKNGFQPA